MQHEYRKKVLSMKIIDSGTDKGGSGTAKAISRGVGVARARRITLFEFQWLAAFEVFG